MHGPNDPVTPRPRRARCLRHHVWMAACTDCRDARAEGTQGFPAAR